MKRLVSALALAVLLTGCAGQGLGPIKDRTMDPGAPRPPNDLPGVTRP